MSAESLKPEIDAVRTLQAEAEVARLRRWLEHLVLEAPEGELRDRAREALAGDRPPSSRRVGEVEVPALPRRVVLESPFAGDVERNVRYARRALRDALRRGEAPLASHLLYTQPGVLRDEVRAERRLGIEAGLAWVGLAAATVVYADRGISEGMIEGIARARAAGRPVEVRHLGLEGDDPA